MGRILRGLALSRRHRLRATRVDKGRRRKNTKLSSPAARGPLRGKSPSPPCPPLCRGEGALASASGREELVRRRVSLLGRHASLLLLLRSGTVRRAQPCHNRPIASGQGLPGKRRAQPSLPEAVPQAQAERRGRSRDARLSTRTRRRAAKRWVPFNAAPVHHPDLTWRPPETRGGRGRERGVGGGRGGSSCC